MDRCQRLCRDRVGSVACTRIRGFKGQVVTFGHRKIVCCCFFSSSEGIQAALLPSFLCLIFKRDPSVSSTEEVIDEIFAPHSVTCCLKLSDNELVRGGGFSLARLGICYHPIKQPVLELSHMCFR